MKKNKESQVVWEFLRTYGLAILSAIIVLGVLYSFGVFSCKSCDVNDCLRNKVCESLDLEFVFYSGEKLYCDFFISDGVYHREEFIINHTELIKIYPECENAEEETNNRTET